MIEVHDLRHVEPDKARAWLRHIADNLRQSDLDEVKASSELTASEALEASYHYSTHAWVILSQTGEPIAAFGAVPHGALQGAGVVWMLGTDGIRREGYSIARKTRRYFDELNAAYFMLWNYIDARNTVSKRWLRWGGFKLIDDHPNFGPEGRLFHSFARTNTDV